MRRDVEMVDGKTVGERHLVAATTKIRIQGNGNEWQGVQAGTLRERGTVTLALISIQQRH